MSKEPIKPRSNNYHGAPFLSAIHAFEALPDSAFLRERDLVAHPRRPGVVGLLSFSAATLRRKVAANEFPKPVKLGARISAWRVGEVRAWMAQQA